MFITTGEEFPVPKLGIKSIVRSIKAVEDDTIEIGEDEYYVLLALHNSFTEKTSLKDPEEDGMQQQAEQGDDEEQTNRPKRKRKRVMNDNYVFF